MSIERSVLEELVNQSVARVVAEKKLAEAMAKTNELERFRRAYDDVDAKWRSLRDRTEAADPKITAMYQAAQALILELRRRKVSSMDVGKARTALVDACREAFPHVDLIPF